MGRLDRLVIHCTDTPEGREVSAADIRRWHTSPVSAGGRGWKQVGYTDMLHLDGRWERLVSNNDDDTVDPWEITNGAKGFNTTSRHVVYVGGQDRTTGNPKDTRTPAQRKAMTGYVRKFKKEHPRADICGHCDLDRGKACPSFNVKQWIKKARL